MGLEIRKIKEKWLATYTIVGVTSTDAVEASALDPIRAQDRLSYEILHSCAPIGSPWGNVVYSVPARQWARAHRAARGL